MSNVRHVDGDILEARAFCNPVNLVGAMGKGLAAQVARRWPACLGAYRAALQTRALRPGTVSAWRRNDGGWILQVPTKRHWRDRSPLELVQSIIRAIGPACARHGIAEIAVPPLGCGLGGLDAAAVRPLVVCPLNNFTVRRPSNPDTAVLNGRPKTASFGVFGAMSGM